MSASAQGGLETLAAGLSAKFPDYDDDGYFRLIIPNGYLFSDGLGAP